MVFCSQSDTFCIDGFDVRSSQYRIVHYNCTRVADLGEATADTPPLSYLKAAARIGSRKFTRKESVELFNNHKDVAECSFSDANGKYTCTVQCCACKSIINVTAGIYKFLEHSLLCMKLQYVVIAALDIPSRYSA